MTHEELVKRAVRWLLGAGRCSVAVSEIPGSSWETADAIGWAGWGSTLVECKLTRADFLQDRKKPFREHPTLGMGLLRYFMVPSGLVDVAELPVKWGLLWVHSRHVKVMRLSDGFAARSRDHEISLLVSLLRRAEIRGSNAHIERFGRRPDPFLDAWLKKEAEATGFVGMEHV